MTLISETIFNPCSSRHTLSKNKPSEFDGQTLRKSVRPDLLSMPSGCLCRISELMARPSLSLEKSENKQWQLGQLASQEGVQREKGKASTTSLKSGKTTDHFAKALKVKGDVGRDPSDEQSQGLLPSAQLPIRDQPSDDITWPDTGLNCSDSSSATPIMTLGVEAFRMALARELSILRKNKENIP